MADATVSLDSVVKHFESLPDPRDTRNRRHLLVDVIVISVCGVIVGCEGPTAIVRWAKAKKDWLGQVLELPNGIPSKDCVRRVLSMLKPAAFQECFQRWIGECLLGDADGSHRTIAIDGKTMRRSHNHAAGLGPLHMVSAFASEHGIALGQIATEEKSNEITAIPKLIDQIDVEGAVVTIDAMGCQKEIAKKIKGAGGDFVLAVKDNQPTLYQAIRKSRQPDPIVAHDIVQAPGYTHAIVCARIVPDHPPLPTAEILLPVRFFPLPAHGQVPGRRTGQQ